MVDIIMVATLLVSTGLVGLLIYWCHKQVDIQDEGRK